MGLSTRARYGTRFMLDLAFHYGEGPVPMRDIAKRQQVSEKYLWNVIGPLKKIGLIRSTRGSSGGFALAKRPSEINMREIVHTLEGPLYLVECIEDSSTCNRAKTCAARDVWSAVSDSIIQTLESITLRDMVENQKDKETVGLKYEI